MWSKPLLCRFCNRGKSSKRRRHKALRRFALPCPGYRHGTPKAGALPTALHPVIEFFIRLGVFTQIKRDTNFATPGYSFFCHYITARRKIKDFSVCGHLCGQSRFYTAFGNRGKSRKCRCCKALRRFASPYPGYRHGTPKPGAIPTSLYPDTFSVYHSCGWKGRENFWFT